LSFSPRRSRPPGSRRVERRDGARKSELHEALRAARRLTRFFALALGSTAAIHSSIAFFGFGFFLTAGSPALYLYLLGLATPSVTALALSGGTDAAGRRRFLRTALRPRGSVGVYLCAVLVQAAFLAVAWCIS